MNRNLFLKVTDAFDDFCGHTEEDRIVAAILTAVYYFLGEHHQYDATEAVARTEAVRD